MGVLDELFFDPQQNMPPWAPPWLGGAQPSPMTFPARPLVDRLKSVGPAISEALPGAVGETLAGPSGTGIENLIPFLRPLTSAARMGANALDPRASVRWPAPPPAAPAAPPFASDPIAHLGISSPEAVPTIGTDAPAAAPPSVPAAPAAPAMPRIWPQNLPQTLAPVGMLDPEGKPYPDPNAPKAETIGVRTPPDAKALAAAGVSPEGGGLFDLIGKNRNMLAMLGAGIAGGRNWGEGISQGLQGAVQGRQLDDKDLARNTTYNALIKKGLDPETARAAMMNPDILKAVLPTLFKAQFRPLTMAEKEQLGLGASTMPWFIGPDNIPRLPEGIEKSEGKFGVVNEDEFGNKQYGFVNPYSQTVNPYNAAGATQQRPTGAIAQELDKVRAAGGDVKAARKELTERVLGKEKPADIVGRLALINNFLKDEPRISAAVQQGTVTGPIDWSAARIGLGEGGEIYRKIASGVDGLRRGLTGAGMPAQEAGEYADRYLPRPWDSAEVVSSKMRQLTAELKEFSRLAEQGRSFTHLDVIGGDASGGSGGYRVLGVR